MRVCDTFRLALAWLLCLSIKTGRAQNGAQNTSAIDGASISTGNTTTALQVNTTSNGLEILTEGSLSAGRDPQCDTVQAAGLTVASCEDAIAQVPDTNTALSDPYGEKLQVPMRYSSCEYSAESEMRDYQSTTY